jgi:hypothetical protein
MNAEAGLFCFPWQVSKYNRFLKLLWKLREKKNTEKKIFLASPPHPSMILEKKLKTPNKAFTKNIDQAAMHPVPLFIRKNS